MTWKTPDDAPCHDCIGTDTIGSAYCKKILPNGKKNCEYWWKLIEMRDRGLLRKVV